MRLSAVCIFWGIVIPLLGQARAAIVYRGDNRPPTEIMAENPPGFHCKARGKPDAKRGTLAQHVSTSGKADIYDSYISTTKIIREARKRPWVYYIDNSKIQEKQVDLAEYFAGRTNPFEKEQEISVLNFIPWEAVIRVDRKTDTGWVQESVAGLQRPASAAGSSQPQQVSQADSSKPPTQAAPANQDVATDPSKEPAQVAPGKQTPQVGSSKQKTQAAPEEQVDPAGQKQSDSSKPPTQAVTSNQGTQAGSSKGQAQAAPAGQGAPAKEAPKTSSFMSPTQSSKGKQKAKHPRDFSLEDEVDENTNDSDSEAEGEEDTGVDAQ
ncbi:uncharacterized protein K489DRAFT_211574 [Dissoconium aciculare CBS 342.82]|jgi:hypothetical protein|uniref:ADP-ribosylation n=1 Tax=Dissoconium aciculare CBS 342.82 TaxID=1314786 RepID=A0A6J3M3L7_9PEZI|nr:uncharacterized protein K489DRAFT_211574 [Dissoconium aciculare CBS 342.82]KAF1822595.1 hypothetical protein K489DRAFT_211574 [Dissoconium aciculare CBS 342.82]